MRASPLLSALFALLCVAQNNGLPSSGPLKPGYGSTPEALKVSEAAGRQPNASSSVTFTRKYNNTDESWTWRINITEIAVPDRVSDLGKDSANFTQGLRVANIQWQLGWPSEDESLQALLGNRNSSVSFTALVSNKPSNITDRYKNEDNGNCAPVLGDQCTKSLTEAASKNTKFDSTTLEGCGDTLNVNGGGQQAGTSFGKATPILRNPNAS